jgi:hypothetical protein
VNAGSLGLVETLIGWPWSERSIRPHIILRRVAIVKDQRESEVRGSVDSKLTGGLTCDNDEAVWRISFRISAIFGTNGGDHSN